MKKVFISEKAIPSNPRSKNYSTGSTIIRTSSGTNNSLLPAQEQLFIKKLDPFGNPYAYTDLPIVTRCGLITYNDDGTINLPDLYVGLPLDGTTIGRDSSGALTVLGGVGSDFDATKMWASLSGSGAEQIHKSHLTDALAGYARTSDIPSLSGYATESWVNDKGYVTTTRLNELIGGASSAFDTLKEIEDYINSHESVTAGLIASLGNKVDKVTGMGLSEHSFTTAMRDKLNSIADGANKYILPVAKAAVLGGVMIGSNINVNAQGVISVAAPYSHPTQQVITTGAARHFLTGLAVNEYGHVTSATSAALTKSDLLAVLKDKDGVIRLDAQLALTGSLINFANLGTVNIPSLYDGIPVDGKSIYWENGTLKSSSTGGGGLAKVIVKIGLAAYESVDGVVTLPAYPTMPDLTNYVTTNTPQTIQGQKNFVSDQIFATGAYFGTNKKGTLHADGSITAEIFRKAGGTGSQLLRADGGISTFNWLGQSGQPTWLWGGSDQNNYYVYNPNNFNVYSSRVLKAEDIRSTNPIPNDRSIRATTTWFNATGTPNGNWYGGLTVRAWEGNYEVWELAGPSHNSNTRNGLYYRSGLGTVWNAWERVITDYNWKSIIDGRYLLLTGGDMSANIVFSADNIGILFKGEAYNALHKSGDNYIFGSAERGIVLRNYNSDLVHSKAGTNYYILDTSNWAGYIDGRYLKLSGGTMAGYIRMPDNVAIQSSEGFGMLFYDGSIVQVGAANRATNIRGNFTVMNNGVWDTGNFNPAQKLNTWGGTLNGELIITTSTHGSQLRIHRANTTTNAMVTFSNDADGILGYIGMSGSTGAAFRQPIFTDYALNSHRIWHSGNDGTGSGLDADLLDGRQGTGFTKSYPNAETASLNFDTIDFTGIDGSFSARCESSVLNPPTSGVYNWSLWQQGNHYRGSQIAIHAYGLGTGMYVRSSKGDTNSWNDWRKVAFEDSNVASATKLQTARYIYGQLFDGTSNISGDLSSVRRIIGSDVIDYNALGHYFYTTGNPNIPLLTLTGNVGIGTVNPGYKLDVYGNFRATATGTFGGHLVAGGFNTDGVIYSTGDASADAQYGYISVMRASSVNNATGFAWVRSGVAAFGIGHNTSNQMVLGQGLTNRTLDPWLRFDKSALYTQSILATGYGNFQRVFSGYDAGVSNAISCSNWFRSNGATGWFNGTYNGGIYMADSDQVRVYNNKVLYNDGFRVWGIDGNHVGLKLYNQHHIGINLANAAYTWGIYAHNNGNMYIGRRNGDVNDISGSYYLIIGAGTMTYNGSIVLNGGGLITYSSDIRLKEIQEYFKPSLSELAALPIFAHSWRNGTPGVQLSTSAQAVQKIMPWNVFEGDDGYLKMDGTRTALAVSIRLAQLANEYITENERWKSDKDRQIEALQREVQSLKQKLNAA